MNDQPREEKTPAEADQPTAVQPAVPPSAAQGEPTGQGGAAAPGQPGAAQGAAEFAAPSQPAAATSGLGGSAAQAPPGAPAAGAAAPQSAAAPEAASQPAGGQSPAQAVPGESAAQAPADQTAVHGQQPPPTPQLSQPGPGQTYAAWGPPAPRQPSGFRRFVGHRATQLVGVGVLGLLIGGGVVGGIAAATSHGPRDGRPGIHRQYDNGNQGFNGRGPGFGGRGNTGNSGNTGDGSGPGDGI